MINKELRKELETQCPDALILESPSFDNSIIGVSENGSIIYDYDKMVEEFMVDEEVNYETAAEFIDYNTIRAIPYFSSAGNAPIIMYKINL